MRKLLCMLLAALLPLMFAVTGCDDGAHGSKNANRIVPEGSVELKVERSDAGTTSVIGIGAEIDPHFFWANTGRTGGGALIPEIEGPGTWECRAEDWDEIFVPRMREMNLKRIRTMLLPSWYAEIEERYVNKEYNWESAQMRSLIRQLDTAKQLNISVNITMWGVEKGLWLAEPLASQWCVEPAEGKEEAFVEVFADCIAYFINVKGYTNITEVTLFNEPNAIYNVNYGMVKGHAKYAALCRKMDTAFRAAGIRDKVKFSLSDDARDSVWLEKTLMELEDVVDIVNSHTYDFGDTYDPETGSLSRDMPNSEIMYGLPGLNLNEYSKVFSKYSIPHMYGEFGTNSINDYLPGGGIDVLRIMLNMFNMGSVGMSYWVLFAQYYNLENNSFTGWGLWGFADEGYACRPVYYSYSMVTRFVEEGDIIYPITSGDDYLNAVAFRRGDKWSYLVVNANDGERQISFLNETKFPVAMRRYIFEENNVPSDNKVIDSLTSLTANGRVLTDAVPKRSFVLYTDRAEK